MAQISKRRRLNSKQEEEITFDPSARADYLTGFHKRKLARIQNAREIAVKREKEEKVKERKQLRDQRKIDLQRHMDEFNRELRKQNPDLDSEGQSDTEGGEFAGFEEAQEAPEPELVKEDEEFVDEEKYTTVTVEPMGAGADSEDDADVRPQTEGDKENGSSDVAAKRKRLWSKDKSAKPKKRKFRYESKAERQETRRKQKVKSKAARARREKGGGK